MACSGSFSLAISKPCGRSNSEIAVSDPFRALTSGTLFELDGAAPRVIPGCWREATICVDGRAFVHAIEPMSVIISAEHHPHPETGAIELWLHCSVARRDRLPTWAELSEVRDAFLGPDTTAYQKLAKRSEHINIHRHCLHLWALVGRELTPDFTRGSGQL